MVGESENEIRKKGTRGKEARKEENARGREKK